MPTNTSGGEMCVCGHPIERHYSLGCLAVKDGELCKCDVMDANAKAVAAMPFYVKGLPRNERSVKGMGERTVPAILRLCACGHEHLDHDPGCTKCGCHVFTTRVISSKDLADFFDRNAVICGNCSAQIVARGGTLGEHNGVTHSDGEDESLCGFCAGEELASRDAEIAKLKDWKVSALEAMRENGEWREKFNTTILKVSAHYAGWHYLQSAVDAIEKQQAQIARLNQLIDSNTDSYIAMEERAEIQHLAQVEKLKGLLRRALPWEYIHAALRAEIEEALR